jgi:hypothetical protein
LHGVGIVGIGGGIFAAWAEQFALGILGVLHAPPWEEGAILIAVAVVIIVIIVVVFAFVPLMLLLPPLTIFLAIGIYCSVGLLLPPVDVSAIEKILVRGVTIVEGVFRWLILPLLATVEVDLLVVTMPHLRLPTVLPW